MPSTTSGGTASPASNSALPLRRRQALSLAQANACTSASLIVVIIPTLALNATGQLNYSYLILPIFALLIVAAFLGLLRYCVQYTHPALSATFIVLFVLCAGTAAATAPGHNAIATIPLAFGITATMFAFWSVIGFTLYEDLYQTRPNQTKPILISATLAIGTIASYNVLTHPDPTTWAVTLTVPVVVAALSKRQANVTKRLVTTDAASPNPVYASRFPIMHNAGIYLTAATTAYAAALVTIAFLVLKPGFQHAWAAAPPLALLLTFGPQRNWLIVSDPVQPRINRLRRAIRIATTTTIWTFLIVPILVALMADVITENPEILSNPGAGHKAIIPIYLNLVDFVSSTPFHITLGYVAMYTTEWFRTGSLSRNANSHPDTTTTA